MPKYTYTRQRRTPLWLCLLLVVIGAMLFTACGGTTSAAPAPTGVASTPTAVASSPTPIPTAVQPTPTPTVQPKPTPGSEQTVMITDGSNGSFGFSPATLTIKLGTIITWKNVSSAPHTVTSDDGSTFDSGNVDVGSSFSFKFTTAGTFTYHCNIHPYMRATIIVV